MTFSIAANIKARLTQWRNNPKVTSETGSFTATTQDLQIADQFTFAESMHAFDKPSRPHDFQFEAFNRPPIFGSHNQDHNAEHAQALQNLIQAMGTFMNRRDDWIVIDDPVGPSKPRMEVLNLFGQS